MELPGISVVIPAWNAADTLNETLEGVFAQDHPDFEVIVVDDGSTDGTPAVLAEWAARHPDRFRFESIPNSGGPARPRNRGVALATRPLVALFDSDDLMEPGKLAAQAAVFMRHPETTLCFTDFMVIDEAGDVIAERMLDDYQAFREHLQPMAGAGPAHPPTALFAGRDLHHALLHANFVGTSSVVVRREALIDAGGFDEELANGDDIEMWLKLARVDSVFAFLDLVGHRYRRTAGGVTARGWRRLPAVAEIRRRQIPFVDDPAVLRLIDEVILSCKIGEAWGLRGDGRLDEALTAYREAQGMRFTWAGFRGILATRLAMLLRR